MERPGGWRFLRIREDKKIPNDERVVERTMSHPIQENITVSEVSNRYNVYRAMID